MNLHTHLPIVLHCRDIIIYVGRKIAYTFSRVGMEAHDHQNMQFF